jgi:tRNA pseudouridine38-40 synthase
MDAAPIDALCIRLRRILASTDPDITIRSVCLAPEGFDARFSALTRTYVYRVGYGDDARDPRLRHFVYALPEDSRVSRVSSVLSGDGERSGSLDIDAMNAACESVIGLHDFGSFSTPNPGGTTIREVKLAQWSRVGEHLDQFGVCSLDSGLIEFHIIADAFAHNMVRSLVGALLLVGQGRKSAEWFAQKIANPVREGATGPAPACGLTLEKVDYPADSELAARAEKIRAKRTLSGS